MGLTLGLSNKLGSGGGGGAAVPVAGATATTLAVTPDVHYHTPSATILNFSDVAAGEGDSVKSVADIMSFADASQVTEAEAPLMITDGLGRKTVTFRDGSWMAIANALDSISARDLTVLLVVRTHRPGIYQYFYPRYNGTTATPNSSNTGAFNCRTSNSALAHGYIAVGNAINTSGARSDATNRKWMAPAASICVIGASSGSSSVRYRCNGKTAVSSGAAGLGTNRLGAVLGAVPGAGDTASATDDNAGMTLYELVVIRSALSDAAFDAACEALETNWGVAAFTDQAVLEGDSIMAGVAKAAPSTNGVHSDLNIAMRLTDPGANLVPATTRVLNIANGGSKTGYSGDADTNTCYYRQNYATYNFLATGELALPGTNTVIVQTGANDLTTETAATTYARITELFDNATTGYLSRGWSAALLTNITRDTTAGISAKIDTLRATINSDFITDVDGGVGGANEGLVSFINLHLVEYAGSTRFEDQTDAADTTYYMEDDSTYPDSDKLHPSALGAYVLASGGTTPSYGVAYGVP